MPAATINLHTKTQLTSKLSYALVQPQLSQAWQCAGQLCRSLHQAEVSLHELSDSRVTHLGVGDVRVRHSDWNGPVCYVLIYCYTLERIVLSMDDTTSQAACTAGRPASKQTPGKWTDRGVAWRCIAPPGQCDDLIEIG